MNLGISDKMEDDDNMKGEIEPAWNKKFNAIQIRSETKHAMRDYFEKNRYNTEDAPYMAQELSKIIRDRVVNSREKDKLRMPRHKVVVQVFMGQKKEQKVNILAKGYWDNYVDNYATYTYEEDDFYCVAVVIGFYTD